MRTLNTPIEKTVPWAVETHHMPESKNLITTVSNQNQLMHFTLTQAEKLAGELKLTKPYSITMPSDEKGVYTLASSPSDPVFQQTYHLDQYSGKILASVGYEDYGIVPKAVEYGIAIHEGKLFGIVNQWVMFIICMMLILVCMTGLIMWCKRRPKGRLGAPQTPLKLLQWKSALGIIIGLAVVLPTVLMSLAIVMI